MPVWNKLKAAMMSSTAAWALGAAGAATAASPAEAACTTSVTSAGGASTSAATQVGDICEITEFESSGSVPAYWEFTWDSSAQQVDINGSVGTGSFFSYFDGNLSLYTSTGSLIDTEAFYAGSFVDYYFGIGSATLGDVTLTPSTDYIIGIDNTSGVASYLDIDFTPAPEPASLGLLGGAVAALRLLRRRRK